MSNTSVHEEFLDAFRLAWEQLTSGDGDHAVRQAYENDRSWTAFVLGLKETMDPSQPWDGLFPMVANILLSKHPETWLIKQIRPEDYSVDLSFVGGEPCLGEKRGWGYASRQFALIEHENNPRTVTEEFHKLIFRIADIKVLAFPDWSADQCAGGSSQGEKALDEFSTILKSVRSANEMDTEQTRNILILVAQRARQGQDAPLPTWRWAWSGNEPFVLQPLCPSSACGGP
ncbi:MAG: hypothetical protein R3F01_08855 [Lysobacteraceae bacterium]|nr:hypothetical protein [Gammaproteobacteria bacterium]